MLQMFRELVMPTAFIMLTDDVAEHSLCTGKMQLLFRKKKENPRYRQNPTASP